MTIGMDTVDWIMSMPVMDFFMKELIGVHIDMVWYHDNSQNKLNAYCIAQQNGEYAGLFNMG